MFRRGTPAHYDFGDKKLNRQKYGTDSAPPYTMAQINSTDIALIYTRNDWLLHLEDVQLLKNSLKGSVEMRLNSTTVSSIPNCWLLNLYPSETTRRLWSAPRWLESCGSAVGQRVGQVCQLSGATTALKVLKRPVVDKTHLHGFYFRPSDFGCIIIAQLLTCVCP